MLINSTLLTYARLSFLVWVVEREHTLQAHRCGFRPQSTTFLNEVTLCKFLNTSVFLFPPTEWGYLFQKFIRGWLKVILAAHDFCQQSFTWLRRGCSPCGTERTMRHRQAFARPPATAECHPTLGSWDPVLRLLLEGPVFGRQWERRDLMEC